MAFESMPAPAMAFDVHRHLPGRAARIQPTPRLRACFPQHPVADLHDQPVLLRERDELVGGHLAALRMGPAQQGLHRLDLQVLEPQARLVIE
jgi:hypothetical protein